MIIQFRPYTDNKNIDMESNLTQIKIYHLGYNRQNLMNGFNPTFSDTSTIIDYNLTDKVSKGLADPNLIYGYKFKFVLFNSNVYVKGVNFTEITFKDFSANSLFY